MFDTHHFVVENVVQKFVLTIITDVANSSIFWFVSLGNDSEVFLLVDHHNEYLRRVSINLKINSTSNSMEDKRMTNDWKFDDDWLIELHQFYHNQMKSIFSLCSCVTVTRWRNDGDLFFSSRVDFLLFFVQLAQKTTKIHQRYRMTLTNICSSPSFSDRFNLWYSPKKKRGKQTMSRSGQDESLTVNRRRHLFFLLWTFFFSLDFLRKFISWCIERRSRKSVWLLRKIAKCLVNFNLEIFFSFSPHRPFFFKRLSRSPSGFGKTKKISKFICFSNRFD